MLARVGGLAAAALSPNATCADAADALLVQQGRVREVARVLVDVLHERIGRSGPEQRRLLLALRRDAFNGRPVGRRRRSSGWTQADHGTGGLLSELARLEDEEAARVVRLAEAYREERKRERRELANRFEDPVLRRGVALSSADLLRVGGRLGEGRYRSGARAARLERSLWRYLSRACFKLSPFSTLTTMALGQVAPAPDAPALVFDAAGHGTHSLVQVHRQLLEVCRDLLLGSGRLRGCARLALNPTLQPEADEPDAYRLLTAGRWCPAADAGEVRYRPMSKVRVRAPGGVAVALRQHLAAGPLPYDEVVERLVDAYVETAQERPEVGLQVATILDRLVDGGFLVLQAPFASYLPRIELHLLAALRSLPHQAPMAPVTAALEELVRAEDELAVVERPEQGVGRITAAADRLLAEVKTAAGLDPGTPVQGLRPGPARVYEDTFLASGEAEGEAVVEIAAGAVDELLRHGNHLLRFMDLYNHRHDLLHTFAAALDGRHGEAALPGQRGEAALPVLDVYDEVAPLWKEYLEFDARERHALLATFNPLQLPRLEELARLRRRIFEQAQRCVRGGGEEAELDGAAFESLLDSIPPRYAPQVGACLFVQPADPRGDRWVLNRLFEGTGRYGSRFSAVMGEGLRRRYVRHLEERSVVDPDGAALVLLDLLYPHQTPVNVHWPQTGKVLALPGEVLGLPAERQVSVGELALQWDAEVDALQLVGPGGERYLPVHLSSLNNLLLPPLIRFLSVFGPYEMRQVLPATGAGGEGGAPRLRLGDLVLQRRRWRFGPESGPPLPERGAGEAQSFAAVRRWRAERGLPERVFVFERLSGDVFKPQFVDFRSPVAVANFLAVAEATRERLQVEEALPDWESFPADGDGSRRAVELQIDQRCLISPAGEPFPVTERAPAILSAVGGNQPS